MTDKFEMVRYDINGKVKDNHLTLWEGIKYAVIVALCLPIIVGDLLGEP